MKGKVKPIIIPVCGWTALDFAVILHQVAPIPKHKYGKKFQMMSGGLRLVRRVS
jgi:hypothetical protein